MGEVGKYSSSFHGCTPPLGPRKERKMKTLGATNMAMHVGVFVYVRVLHSMLCAVGVIGSYHGFDGGWSCDHFSLQPPMHFLEASSLILGLLTQQQHLNSAFSKHCDLLPESTGAYYPCRETACKPVCPFRWFGVVIM